MSALLFEVGLRVLRHPIDYLQPVRVSDPVLFLRLLPETGAHDEWGFRNLDVPRDVDVVAIGDSNTWGINATWEKNWPGWYSQLTGKSIYNFGVPAYGPAEQFYLLKNKALQLEPELIILALYLGNDFGDAYRTVSTFPYWAAYRTDSMPVYETIEESEFVPRDLDAPEGGESVLVLRNWLRRNSMLFRIIEEGPLGQKINAWGDQWEGSEQERCVLTATGPSSTVFSPEIRFLYLDPDRQEIQEGVDLTLRFVQEMADLASENGIGFIVVLVPTKESVLIGSIDEPEGRCATELAKVVEAEKHFRDRVRDFLRKSDIWFVDPLDALRTAAAQRRIYIRSFDSHPNEEGYRVIAEEVVKAVEPGR